MLQASAGRDEFAVIILGFGEDPVDHAFDERLMQPDDAAAQLDFSGIAELDSGRRAA